MKRSHDLTRVLGLSVCVMFAMQVCAQRSFDEYFKMVKAREMGQQEIDFMKECGVDAAASDALYGVKLGAIDKERWSPRELLGRGQEEGFADFYTAEIRVEDGKPRMINTWWVTKETGEAQNTMYCLSEQSKVKTVLTLNLYDPPAGVKGTATRYLRRQEISSLGRVTADRGTFVDEAGAPVATPKLSKQDLNAAQTPGQTVIAYEVLRDLWALRRRPMVVPYEQQPAIQGNR